MSLFTDPFGNKKAAKIQQETAQQQIAAQEKSAALEREERQTALAKEEATRQEAIERKETAVRDIKFPTVLEGEAAQQLRGTLEERIAGRGLLDIDKQTAPFAAQRRASLREQEIPIISAAASARGLGRSTIPVSQIGQASQAAERDIESRVAGLQIENQKLVSDAIGRFQDLVGRESTSQEQKAIFERGGEFNIADTITTKAGAISAGEQNEAIAFSENQFSIADSIAQNGADLAANKLKETQIILSGLAGLALSSADTTRNIIESIDKREQRDRLAAQVAIG